MKQSYSNLEIILIDDGSTDKSADMCKQFAKQDNRIKYIKQVNQGAGAARRRGVIEACGQFIFFIDSDDYLEFDALQSLRDEMSADIDCVVGQHKRFGDVKNIKQYNFPVGVISAIENKNQVLIKQTTKSTYGQELWNKLFRASVVKQAFEREITVPYGEDSLYLVELYMRMRKVKCIHKLTYHYDFRLDSLARRTRALKILPAFSKEIIALHDSLRQFSFVDIEPLIIAHVLNIALLKYRGEDGESALIEDFPCLYDSVIIRNARCFIKNKKEFKKKFSLTDEQFYFALGLYKAIASRNPWYYLKWYPVQIDKTISLITRLKVYVRKRKWRKIHEINK